jgi:hypothetical protein
MIPSREASDNYQAIHYQNEAKTIGSCGVCHANSRGDEEDIGGFAGQHGGTQPQQRTVCNVCHTSVRSDRTQWPHAYQWHNSN